MAKISPSDGFKVHGWMVTRLNLSGGELVTFAIVHQFSQSKDGIYAGGVPYISKFLGMAPNTVRKHLRSLVAKAFIEALPGDRNGVPFIHYRTLQNLKGRMVQEMKGDPSTAEGSTLQKLQGLNREYKKEYNGENKYLKRNTKKKIFRPVPKIVTEMLEIYGKNHPNE